MEGFAYTTRKGTSGDTEGARIWGDSLGAISHIKLSQGAFTGNPPVSLVPPVSLLVGFPALAYATINKHVKLLHCLCVGVLNASPQVACASSSLRKPPLSKITWISRRKSIKNGSHKDQLGAVVLLGSSLCSPRAQRKLASRVRAAPPCRSKSGELLTHAFAPGPP